MTQKGKKTIIILLICLAVLIIACLAVTLIPKLNNKEVSYKPNFGKAEKIAYNCGGENEIYSFVQESGEWRCAEEPEYPIKQSAIEQLAGALEVFEPQSVIEPQDDISEYGLKEPVYFLEAVDTQGNTLSLKIGQASSSSNYYAICDGIDGICVITQTLPLIMKNDIYSRLDVQGLPKISADSIIGFEITDISNENNLKFEQKDGQWLYYNGNEAVDDGEFSVEYDGESHTARKFRNDLKSAVTGMESCKCISYGMDYDKQLRVNISTGEGDYSFYLCCKDNEESYCITQDGDRAAYDIEKERADVFFNSIKYLGK